MNFPPCLKNLPLSRNPIPSMSLNPNGNPEMCTNISFNKNFYSDNKVTTTFFVGGRQGKMSNNVKQCRTTSNNVRQCRTTSNNVEQCDLINYPVASLFSSVEVKLNDKTIMYGLSNYAERAIMEVLMTYNNDALKAGWELDFSKKTRSWANGCY